MSARDGRQLPQDVDSEMALLGLMMMDRTVIDDVRPIVTEAAAFAVAQHGIIFDALLGVHDAGLPMDLLAVTNELRKREQLAEIGGQKYLIQLSESFAEWSNAEYYARQVRGTHQERMLIGLGIEVQNLAYEALREPDDILAIIAQRIDVIERQGNDDRDAVGESDLLRNMPNPSDRRVRRVPVCIGALQGHHDLRGEVLWTDGAVRVVSNAPNQIPPFDKPRTTLDRLRVLWSQTTEPERMVFLEKVRRTFVFRRKPSPAEPDGPRQRGVA